MRNPYRAAPLLLATLHRPRSWRARAGAVYLAAILNAQVVVKD